MKDSKVSRFRLPDTSNLNRVVKRNKLQRECKELKYAISVLQEQRKAKLKEANELQKEIMAQKALKVMAK